MRAKFDCSIDYDGMTINHIRAIATDEILPFPFYLKSGHYIDVEILKFWYTTQRLKQIKFTLYTAEGNVIGSREYGGSSWMAIPEVMARLQLFVTNNSRCVANEETAEVLLKIDSLRSAPMVDTRPVPEYEACPIDDLSRGMKIYTYTNDREFTIDCIGRHGQDCSQIMIGYRNTLATDDAPAGTLWFLSESMLRKLFYVKELK